MDNEKELQRLHAFSDGVFAIAATLLILEIKVPKVDDLNTPGALWKSLQEIWPSFFAFVLSFGSILVMWVNHHHASHIMERCSRPHLYANGFLLLTVTFIPYPTSVLAEYINTPQANIAVMFYASSFMLANIGFNIWWFTMQHPLYLLKASIREEERRKVTMQTISGMIVYLLTVILAYWYPTISIILIAALFILWVTLSVGDGSSEERF